MLKKEAREITGGLSEPNKMPGPSINLPAVACLTGRKLVNVKGSTCSGCYALKGRYRFPNVKDAMQRRLDRLYDPRWGDAMVTLVDKQPVFRWHDSGDLQSVQHLINIFEVCKLTPGTMHWLPTQERKFLPLSTDSIPKNLMIRLSNAKNDTKPGNAWPFWSTVVSHQDAPIYGATRHLCPAPEQGNECGSCRACWSRDVHEVQYKIH